MTLASALEISSRSTGFASVLREQFEGPYTPANFVEHSVTLEVKVPTVHLRGPAVRQFSLIEQKVVQAALRASVTIVHKARRSR